jgi:choline kinase
VLARHVGNASLAATSLIDDRSGSMRAVILAAGRGERLRDVTGVRPKCLARVGVQTLLEHQLQALTARGVSPITVVAGYSVDEVRRVCDRRADVRYNAAFASTNSLYSLWLARDLLADGFVVLNCDVLFHAQLLGDLLTAEYEDALLVAARGDDRYSDEEMKVRIRAGRVTAISKTIVTDEADGENIGIAKFGPSGGAVLVEELDRLIAAGCATAWAPAAFDAFCTRRPLYAIESRGLPWIEIDTPEDYWRACGTVLPRIDGSHFRRSSPEPAALTDAPGRRSSVTETTGDWRPVRHV